MFTAYVDERDFCFVSYYKCDFIHIHVGALFVSVSSQSNAEQATAVRQKQVCNHVAVFCFWFCFVLIHFVLLSPVQSDLVLLQSSLHLSADALALVLARFKSNQFYI